MNMSSAALRDAIFAADALGLQGADRALFISRMPDCATLADGFDWLTHRWTPITHLEPRPSCLSEVRRSSEVMLDSSRRHWLLRDRAWVRWYGRGWSEPRVILP